MRLFEMKGGEFLTEAINPKYLFISFSEGGKQEALRKRLKDTLFVVWSDISVVNGDIVVNSKFPLDGFSFILIGAVGESDDIAGSVLSYITNKKLRYLSYGTTQDRHNKILQSVRLAELSIPQIKTVISRCDKTSAGFLIKELKLPVVSKIVNGSQGKGIKKHDTKESLESHLKKHDKETLIFQEFIPNDGDIRVFFLKTRLVYAIIRNSVKKGEFRNNTSLGGKEEQMDLKNLESSIKTLSTQATKAMGFDVTGVDLIQHRDTKDWYVMEINSAPQFDGDSFDDIIDDIVEIIKQ